ncbi:MAG TPA: mechanosensitive ion channel domain-containing protein [Wenzhouxiangella sp.]|nr:mechanosensitive ion channel domain-containing protein [Wenzhouxiangella sp.]
MEAIREWIAGMDSAGLMAVGWKLLGALLIFIIGRWVAQAITALLVRAMTRRKLDAMLVSFLEAIFYITLLLCVVLAAISYLGIAITPLIAILGGAALAVGLALQSTLSNFAAGFMLVIYKPFTKGHYVTAGGVSGTVDRVGLFNTWLITTDNCRVTVPNSVITESAITNFSAFERRRCDMNIRIDPGDDLKTARAAIMNAITGHEKVLADPEPALLLMELTDYSVNFSARAWLRTSDFWAVRSELLGNIKESLEASGCSIALPQHKVHYAGDQSPKQD